MLFSVFMGWPTIFNVKKTRFWMILKRLLKDVKERKKEE